MGIWIDPAKGHLLIKGGKFITVADSAQILKYEGGTLGISGGTFSQDMTPYLSSSYCCRKSDAYYIVGSHLYQLKNTSETYLKTEAGCTNPAEYYMSCACGKAGTDFFTYGDPLGHSFTNYVSNDNATCTENGTETASCNRGCGATDEREIPDSAKGHSYQNGKCTVCGDESQCGDHLSWKFDADTGTLTISGTGDMTAYTDGGAPWYVYKDSITALNLEEGITSIGDYAFAGCSKVATIVLPDSVTAFHRCGFANMTGLTSVTFGEDLAQLGSPGDTKVVHSPFSQCTSLEEIIFTGTTVPVKYGYPFTNMDMASEATIYVPAEYFREYAAFLTYTVQHAKITSKDATEEFQIRDGVLEAYFGDDAEVTIPDTVTTIGYGAFNNNLNITKVNLHDGVTEIEDYVFCNCSNLTEVQWSGNLTRIGGWSFFHCVGLKEMILPDSVTEIGDYAFSGCTGLTDVTFEGNAPVMHSSTFYRVKATVFYPADDATWTESVRKNYNGTLTWEPYDSTAYRVSLDAVNLGGYGSVWIDGVEYAVQTDGDNCYVDLQDDQAKTMVAWDSQLGAGNPLTLGNSYVKSNFAYKKGVADPVFAYDGDLMQYTNVLVNFSDEQCKNELALRPYMILKDANGKTLTIYGGILYRSIGYIAYQNRDIFEPQTAEYNYIWDIIHYVYGDVYDDDFIHAWTPPNL